MAKIKGICRNEECDHCDEIMEAEKSNFVCEYCQKPLFPISAKETGGGGDGPNWKLIGIIIAAIAVLGGGAFFAFNGGEKSQTDSGNTRPGGNDPEPQTVLVQQVTVSETAISLKVGDKKQLGYIITPEKHDENILISSSDETVATVSATGEVTAIKAGSVTILFTADKSGKQATVNVTVTAKPGNDGGRGTGGGGGVSSGKINLGYGIYEGPVSGGKANGIGGEIRFTSNHTIDLKKGTGETVEVNAGDKMINVKMKDNQIIQGQLKRSDGSQKWIIIG